MSRAVPLALIALMVSCSGRLLQSDSAIDASDAGPSDANSASTIADDSSTIAYHGDGCTPAGPPAVLANTPGVASLVIDETNAYWSGDNAIYRCPIDACTTPIEIAPLHNSAPTAAPLAIDSDNIYFVDIYADSGNASRVFRCPKVGCAGTPEQVSPDGVIADLGHVFLDDTSIYWMGYDSGTQKSAVMRIGKDLTGLTEIAGAQGLDAVSHGKIFWIVLPLEIGVPDGKIMAWTPSEDGGAATVYAGHQESISGLAVDDENLYWTADADFGNTDGSIQSCPLTGCTGEPTIIASGLYAPFAITVDACGIYWTSDGSPPDSSDWRLGDAFMCEKPACSGDPTIIATGQYFPSQIAVNARGIFWSNYEGGNVMRVPR